MTTWTTSSPDSLNSHGLSVSHSCWNGADTGFSKIAYTMSCRGRCNIITFKPQREVTKWRLGKRPLFAEGLRRVVQGERTPFFRPGFLRYPCRKKERLWETAPRKTNLTIGCGGSFLMGNGDHQSCRRNQDATKAWNERPKEACNGQREDHRGSGCNGGAGKRIVPRHPE